MGPQRRSLAQRIPAGSLPERRRTGILVVCLTLFVGLLLPSQIDASDEPEAERSAPSTSALERVHRVQIDVSVIDPKSETRASVAGIPREAFSIRLDGARLEPEVAARVEFDTVCPTGEAGKGELPLVVDETPKVVVFVDLNFLDLRMKHAVADALDEVAGMMASSPIKLKVLAFSRQLVALTDGFTDRPESVRLAADDLRATVATPARIEPFSAGDPLRRVESRDAVHFRSDVMDPRALLRDRVMQERIAELSEKRGVSPFFFPAPGEADPMTDVFATPIDPRPSLAAIESVLVENRHLRGRKALVLFSSRAFDYPGEIRIESTSSTRLAAQGGFTIWSVDAGGLDASTEVPRSPLLDALALSTGGESLATAGRLSSAVERAIEQMSCYYLFSIPVRLPESGRRHHHVDVTLRDDEFPELGALRIRAPGGFTLLDREADRQRRRLAALLQPQAHRYPEVRVSATYPTGRLGRTSIGVAAVLKDLHFEPRDGAFLAELAVQGLVIDGAGETICRIGDGRTRQIRVDERPADRPPSLVVFETRCELRKPGLYDVRVLVEDVFTGDVGAMQSRLVVHEPDEDDVSVIGLRLGRNSGRDFLTRLGPGTDTTIPRDRSRRAFTPVLRSDVLVPSDRLIVRYVTCGAEAPPLTLGLRFDEGASLAEAEPAFRLAMTPISPRASGNPRRHCVEYEGSVPESSLSPGRYVVGLVNPEFAASTPEELARVVTDGGLMAHLEFEVSAPPPVRPEPAPRPVASALADVRHRSVEWPAAFGWTD